MIECDIHGLKPATHCCLHVWRASNEGLACEMDYVFDDFGEGYLVCSNCLVIARQYAKAHRDEEIESYPIEIRHECRAHLGEWSEKMNHVDMAELFVAAEKRTRERPER
jgi:hypothetical protein